LGQTSTLGFVVQETINGEEGNQKMFAFDVTPDGQGEKFGNVESLQPRRFPEKCSEGKRRPKRPGLLSGLSFLITQDEKKAERELQGYETEARKPEEIFGAGPRWRQGQIS